MSLPITSPSTTRGTTTGPTTTTTTSDEGTTTTSDTSTTTTSTTSTTSSTSSTTSSSSTTSAPSTTSSSSSSTSKSSSSTSIITITSGDTQITHTVVIQPSVTTNKATATAAGGSGDSFFDNKGAVAGTFTAVGLVALAGIIFLLTLYIRRRRQKQFDREVDEAALEAATAPAPAFLDDDDDMYAHSAVRSNYTGPSSNGYYSNDAASHGTYAQAPMSSENYGMTEMSNLNRHGSIGPGQIFNPSEVYASNAAAGAAGIGVSRARSMSAQPQEQQGYGLAEGNTPYAAFAGPSYNQNGQSQPQAQYGGEAYAVATNNLQRGPSDASMYNPYGGVAEPVPPLPTGTPLNRSPSNATSLTNPHDRQISPPPMPTTMSNPHSPMQEDTSQAGTTHIAGRVFSGGDFGGGSTPEFGQAPIHAAQTGEQGRWSDYNDEDHVSPSDESAGKHMPIQEDSDDDEEEEERPKVFKVTN